MYTDFLNNGGGVSYDDGVGGRRRWPLIAAIAAVLAVAGIAVFFVMTRSSGQSTRTVAPINAPSGAGEAATPIAAEIGAVPAAALPSVLPQNAATVNSGLVGNPAVSTPTVPGGPASSVPTNGVPAGAVPVGAVPGAAPGASVATTATTATTADPAAAGTTASTAGSDDGGATASTTAAAPGGATETTTPTVAPGTPYPKLPDGEPQPVVAIFDTSTITLTGEVPTAAAAERLSQLVVANSQTPASVVNNLIINPDVPASVGVRVIELNSARFPTGSSTVLPAHGKELDRVANVMKALPNVSVLVIGHADQRGNDKDNFTISTRRAQAVLNYLIFVGVSPARLSSRGVGSTDLLSPQTDDTLLMLNRRTEFIFYGLLIP